MGNIVLTPELADSIANSSNTRHLVVASGVADTEEVKWSNVNTDVLSESRAEVPCSKIVFDIKKSLSSVPSQITTISDDILTMKRNIKINTDGLVDLSDYAYAKIDVLSSILDSYSAIKNILNHKSVKFIGVSTTDPMSGIITIDGIEYNISSDFDESNNGNIVYYHTNTHNSNVTEHSDRESVGILYAYIYSNGIFSDKLAVTDNQLPVSVSEENSETDETVNNQTNTIKQTDPAFTKIGYGFYENLSTLIHDDMVCDDAAIKMHKIDGLEEALQGFDARINQCNTDIAVLRGNIDTINEDIDSIRRDYALKTNVASAIDDLSSEVATNFVKKTVFENTIAETAADLQSLINRTSESLTNQISSLEGAAKLSVSDVISDLNSHYVRLSSIYINNSSNANKDTKVTSKTYVDNKIATCVKLTSVISSTTNFIDDLNKTDSVPAMNMLKQLSASIMNAIEPDIGTLKFVATKRSASIDINAANFDGWVYANGKQYNVNKNDFVKACAAFGPNKAGSDTSFTVPNFSNQFVRGANMADDSAINGYSNAQQNFHLPLLRHTHDFTTDTNKIETNETTVSTSIAIQCGSGSGSGLHWGYGTSKNVYSNVSFTIPPLQSDTKIKETGDAAAEPLPRHVNTLIMIYIGKKRY